MSYLIIQDGHQIAAADYLADAEDIVKALDVYYNGGSPIRSIEFEFKEEK